ncbi:MAG: hypothetical protein U9Q78_00935 [Chloroflexota bacterium]|nr:hypothetical protein [Chloroflexota bacterium]
MIDHVWTVVCSRSVIDRDSNNVCLLNVLEQITVGGKPTAEDVEAIPIEMEVVSLWARSDLDVPTGGAERLTLVSPSGEVLFSGESEIDLSAHRRFRNRARFRGLPIREEGRYVFRVESQADDEVGWHHAADIPLEVIFEEESGQ